MDITNLTRSEAEKLLSEIRLRLEQINLESRNEQNERNTRIESAITQLDNLLGPENGEPGVDSIRAVRGFDGQVMADNAEVALPLAFHGLEILTTVVRDIAATIAHEQ